MKIKTEALKAIVFIVIGVVLWARFQPKNDPKQTEISQAQDQTQECKVVTKIVTNKDGSKIETTEVVAKSAQSQEQKIIQSEAKKNAVFLGLATDKKASVDLVLGKWSHELRSDFKKDHVYQLSYKVLEF